MATDNANATTVKLNENALAKVEDTATQLEQISKSFGLDGLVNVSPIMRAVRLSQGVQALREILTIERVKFLFMPLMGSPLGFLTDRDRKPDKYSPEVVRDVLVEAFLRGFMPTGNEFNIISERFYAAHNGLERKVLEFKGVSGVCLTPGVPEPGPAGSALVSYRATWYLDGEQMSIVCENKGGIDTRIPVNVNNGMGPDAILGKAERKIYHRILKRLLGNSGAILGSEESDLPLNVSVPLALSAVSDPPAVTSPAQNGQRLKLNREPGQEG